MRITRNGIEFELTPDELWKAFVEQRHLNFVADVKVHLEHDVIVNGDIMFDIEDVTDDELEEMGTQLEELVTLDDRDWEDALNEVIFDFIEEKNKEIQQ